VMGLDTLTKGCINQKKGDITDDQLFTILQLMPSAMNAVGMAKTFYYMLDAYSMADDDNVAKIFAVLVGAMSAAQREKSEEGEDNEN
jgi:hypothetical protein